MPILGFCPRRFASDWHSRFKLWRCARLGGDTRVVGRVRLHGTGRIKIGRRVLLNGGVVGIELLAGEGAELTIGDDVTIDEGTSIEALAAVRIGDGAAIGAYVKILDNNQHVTTGDRHAKPDSTDLTIGKQARIGDRAVLLPGTKIGAAAVLMPGTVVSRAVPAGVTIAGNPPRPYRHHQKRNDQEEK